MSSNHHDGYVLGFDELGATDLALVGGKGANLGELSRIAGVHVPAGCCVTVEAFRRTLDDDPTIKEDLDQLARVESSDRDTIGTISAQIRRLIEGSVLADDVTSAISDALIGLGEHAAYAVRSSATVEDLPTASFAGQHDTSLNVVGLSDILDHVRRCWASAFTERADAYRRTNGIDPRSVAMAVVLQRMVDPQVSGVMFTADPVSFDRTIVAVEACAGLGEALVSGLVTPDVFRVRDAVIIDRAVVSQRVAIRSVAGGGTRREELEPDGRNEPTLTDGQAVRLAALGRRIEASLGSPQDIEWCLLDGDFQIVQSRPITTLFPIPVADDDANRVYVSVGHQQMMTDAMKPLGLSLWQMTTPAPMAEAGGRLFVDVTARLAAKSSRADLLEVFGRSDPLLRDALQTVLDREGFVPSPPDDAPIPPPTVAATEPLDADPAIVAELIDQSQASIAACRHAIATKSGLDLLDFIVSDLVELRRLLFDPASHRVFMTAMDATWWINEHVSDWLGEQNVADALTQSVPDNVTSEMGLALLDVADVVRPHADVVAFLQRASDDTFLGALDDLDGGSAVRAAIEGFLDTYGMRCTGEIDITRPRWAERPTTLLPLVLAHVENMDRGEAAIRFEAGRAEASTAQRELLDRLRILPGGAEKVAETQKMIDRVRTFIGYREYPKYAMVCRYFIYKRALMAEAARLVGEGVLREPEDVFYLRFDELREVVRTGHVDGLLIDRRKQAFRTYQRLTPPRVLTSDGEAVAGSYRRDDLPTGSFAGLGVSAGSVEGRARVVSNIADADLEPGDILVTAYTDPSWTPLFVTVAGLVTEVGGMMTHGAVIAREYGLPAVVGVDRATERILDGQRIRIDGNDGCVTVLSQETR